MIPLVTDLNRSAVMSHSLKSPTGETFEVGDRVIYQGYKHPNWNGRTGEVTSVLHLTVKVDFDGEEGPRYVTINQLNKID